MEASTQRTSDLLEQVVENSAAQDSLSIGELKEALHERGFGVITALAALPVCTPIPMPPGYTTLFSIPLFILSVQMILGNHTPWLPSWLEKRRIKRTTLALLVSKGNPLLRKIEKLLRPRLTHNIQRWEKMVGIFGFIFTVSIFIPLPLTNTIPGIGVLMMALGLLSRDGIVILLGIIVGCVGCVLTTAVLYLGSEAVTGILQHLSEGDIEIIMDHPSTAVPPVSTQPVE